MTETFRYSEENENLKWKGKKTFPWSVNHETPSVYVYSFKFLLSKYVQTFSRKATMRSTHLSNIYKIKGEKTIFLTQKKSWTLHKFLIKIKISQVRKKYKRRPIFCYRLAKIPILDFNPKKKSFWGHTAVKIRNNNKTPKNF